MNTILNEKYKFRDLIDLNKMNILLGQFAQITGLHLGLLEYPSQEIIIDQNLSLLCRNFHLVHSATSHLCLQNRELLIKESLLKKDTVVKKCFNGLITSFTPIYLEDQVYAFLLAGQILFEEKDIETFKKNAKEYNFNEDAYFNALDHIKILKEERFYESLSHVKTLISIISEISLECLKRKQLEVNLITQNAQLIQTTRTLEEKEQLLLAQNEELIAQEEELTAQNEDLRIQEEALTFQNQKLKDSHKEIDQVNKRFEQLFNSARNGIAVYSVLNQGETFIIKDFNKTAEEVEHVNKIDIIGKDVTDVFPGIVKMGLLNTFKHVYQTGIPELHELSFYKDDKISGWRKNYVIKLPTDEIIAVYEDVTDFKNMEQQFQLAMLSLEEATIGIFWADSAGKFIYVNKSATIYTGYNKTELMKMHFYDLDLKNNADFLEEKWKLLRTNGSINIETNIKKRNGTIFPASITSNYIAYEDREYCITFLIDISEQKKAEEKIQVAYKNLEFKVNERTKNLMELNAELLKKEQELSIQNQTLKRKEEILITQNIELEKINLDLHESRKIQKQMFHQLENTNLQLINANRHKDKFLSTMSHELRTPLNAILGFAQVLIQEHYGVLNEKQHEYSELILKSGEHLLTIISDILDISKIDSGSMEINIEKFYPVDVINEIIIIMKNQYNQKNILLDFVTCGEDISIKSDRQKTKQVLLNLLSNSLKFTQKNGFVNIIYENNTTEDFIKISIKDTGIGIEEKGFHGIFNEFFQASHGKDQVFGGTGIGLALSKRLIEMQNGTIGFESKYGEGSKFWFTLKK